MRKLILLSITIYFLLFILPLPATGQADYLEIHFFGSRTCAECLEIKETILKPLAAEFPESIDLHLYDIEDPESFLLMVTMEELHGITDPSPQELFLPGAYLAGADDIMASGESLIREYLADPSRWEVLSLPDNKSSTEYENNLKVRFDNFTFVSVMIAGLVDGVNPCAIATMIFLVSFLAHQKRDPTQIIIIGMTFTITVYITYLLLGLGAFKIITGLEEYRLISILIRWSAVAAAAIVGIISLRDAWAYKKSGATGDIILQMPRSVKIRMHKMISGHLRGRHIIFGAFVTGFLVTLFEAVCTGQVYLPTIILMTRSAESNLTGWLYLLFYNFLFVLPLLIVMIAAYFGLTWHTMANTTQRHLFLLKILLGCVMVGLAFFLALA